MSARSEGFRSAAARSPLGTRERSEDGTPSAPRGNGPDGRGPSFSRRALRFRSSTIRSGRVIGERREKLETASERIDAHKRIKRRQISRIIVTAFVFIFVAVVLVFFGKFFFVDIEERPGSISVVMPYSPTIEIIDEDAGITGAKISSRMKEYIGQAESDFRELGYKPIKAVLPAGAIREIDFYLDGYNGFIKFTLDRATGVSVEDTDRMIRYLAGKGISDFQYIDVRLDGKAYWR